MSIIRPTLMLFTMLQTACTAPLDAGAPAPAPQPAFTDASPAWPQGPPPGSIPEDPDGIPVPKASNTDAGAADGAPPSKAIADAGTAPAPDAMPSQTPAVDAGAGHCQNGVKDGDESDVDCGGSCPACPQGKLCGGGADCASGTCAGPSVSGPGCPPETVNVTHAFSTGGNKIWFHCRQPEKTPMVVGTVTLEGFTADGGCNDEEGMRSMEGTGPALLLKCSNTEHAFVGALVYLSGATASGACPEVGNLLHVWTAGGKLMMRCRDLDGQYATAAITFSGPQRCK